LTHVVQQGTAARRFAFSPGPSSVSIRGFSLPRIARDPPRENNPRSKDPIHPDVLVDLQETLKKFYEHLSPKERWKLYRNSTIAFAVVTEKSAGVAASARLVYTVAGNRNSKEIEEAAEALNLQRWNPAARAAGRGATGAPNDAEQLMVEALSRITPCLGYRCE
jgi:hypothetical protein